MRMLRLVLGSIALSACVGVTTFRGSVGDRDDELSRNLKSSGEFLYTWGPPERKESLAQGGEKWIYSKKTIAPEHDEGRAWRGFVLWAVVPVPIMVPVGHNDVVVYFAADGSLIKEHWEVTDEDFYGCIVIPLRGCGHNVRIPH